MGCHIATFVDPQAEPPPRGAGAGRIGRLSVAGLAASFLVLMALVS